MKKSNLKKITQYLSKLPDNLSKEIVNFIGYLSYQQKIDSEYPYPDEKAAIKEFKKHKKTVSWDKIKHSL